MDRGQLCLEAAGLEDAMLRWAASNGLMYRSKTGIDDFIIAPFTKNPFPIPTSAFEISASLAPLWGKLVHGIAKDSAWLVSKLESTAEGDPFTGRLLLLYKQCLCEGIVQPLCLGIFRSDYMTHEVEGDARTCMQVELNTIASSFGGLATGVARMHQQFAAGTVGLLNAEHSIGALTDTPALHLPENHALDHLLEGLSSSHKAYSTLHPLREKGARLSIAMVVQKGERNFADQSTLEFGLASMGIPVMRVTMAEILQYGSRDLSTNRFYFSPPSPTPTPAASGSDTSGSRVNSVEFSVFYFRAGYTPCDYGNDEDGFVIPPFSNITSATTDTTQLTPPTPPSYASPIDAGMKLGKEWVARLEIERSRAIKCPPLSYHLAGTKKIQQVVAIPGVLERFLTSDESEQMRKVFAGLYTLDREEEGGAEVGTSINMAIANPQGYVLKPQREGGGNNLYKTEMVNALRTMNQKELASYILMERIQPPSHEATLIRGSLRTTEQCVCEFGVFSCYLDSVSSGTSGAGSATGTGEKDMELLRSASCRIGDVGSAKGTGYLVRVKMSRSDEGGVAAGYAFLSSAALHK